MNQHQILTGAVNAGDCYSVGSVEGVPFTAYSAGCNIVILASNFQRVQIIPGILHGNVQVNCLDCSTDVGKIAAAYGKNICIFEPTPILDANTDHKLNYKWIKTAVLQTDCYVSVISWNLEGTKLLTGGTCIQLWHLIGTDKNDNTDLLSENNDNQPINFKLNNNEEQDSFSSQDSFLRWACVWQCSTATNVCFLSFSPDGSLFVSAGKTDRLAKIWYRSAANHDYSGQSNIIGSEAMQKRLTSHINNVNYTFVYIVHPRAITGICWRKTSKYMPKSSVANMLVTSCKDNISRLWVQTLLPEDGLVNFNSIEGLEQNTVPRVHTTRHRQKIMQRLKHMKTFSQFRKRHASNNKNEESETNLNQMNNQPIPNMPSTYSVHDFHCFGIHGAAMIPGIHFHLAASINAKSDIPLVPKLEDDLNDVNNTNEKSQPSFVMHWLNNKEMIFTQQAEKLLQQISKKIFKAEENANKLSDNDDTDENLSNDEELAMNEDTKEQQFNDDDNLENEMNSSTLNAEAGKKFRHKLCKNVGVSKKLKKKKELILKQIQENHQKIHPLTPNNNVTNTAGQDKDLDIDPDSSISAHVRSSIHTLSSSHSNVDLLNNTPAGTTVTSLGDFIDRKFETLLREWHTSYDLLFSIHPVDGSLLVWLVEWLDESCPGSFRAQVSFSSRIPNAIPLGDAITMSHNVSLYAPQSFLDLRFVIASNNKQFDDNCCEYGCCRIEPTTNENKKEEEEDKKSNESNKDNGINNDKEDDDDELYQNDQNKELDKNKMLLLTPTVCMVTKHNNGSLNLWHIGFAENTNFTQVLSISHENRVCGHRFRVNDISCHPVLPLLLTTSHHNLPGLTNSVNKNSFTSEKDMLLNDVQRQLQSLPNSGFCSELILWKVDSVGPLSKSGGVTELARINSPNTAAFANVAWIPTLLPSTTLGSISNSPSACFIASDGNQLHVYQSVIDARTLLAEISSAHRTMSLDSSGSFDDENAFDNNYGFQKNNLKDAFKIVSLQSTSRPGCILELDAIADANHDWQNTQLLHVFQDQMITGDVCYNKKNKSQENLNNPSLFEPGLDAVVDLRHTEVFKEPFYLVLLEKNEHQQSVIHMWKLVISSQTDDAKSNKYSYVPDSNLVQDFSDGEHSNLGTGSRMDTPDFSQNQQFHYHRRQSKQSSMWKQAHHQSYTALENEFTPLKIKTEKVCTQILPLPEDVEVIHATPAAGHLSSSNIYPACFAPYLLCTACSDGSVRFWKCQVSNKNQQQQHNNTNKQQNENVDGYEEDDEYDDEDLDNNEYFINKKNKNNQLDSDKFNYNWTEWEFMIGENKSSMIEVSGFPLYVSCAYSGRIACAYKDGQSYSKPTSKSPNTRFININLAIYECESTGGSEWNCEDVIHLKNIVIPQTDNNVDIDLTSLIDTTVRNKKTADTLISKITSQEQEQIDGRSTNYIQRLLSVPSYTTIQTLKKIISEQGNQFTLTQKSIVQLDWVSTEDGSHVLSVSVGNKISIFTPVSTDIAQANLQAMKASLKTGTTTTNRMLLKQASSMVANPNSQDDIRWMSLRTTHLKTADGLSPLPMQMSWVRDGILVVGMDNEMHIYSQWKSNSCNSESTEETLTGNNVVDTRVLTEHGLLTHAQESSHLRLPAHNIPRTSSNSNLTSLASKTESNSAQLDHILNNQTNTTLKSTNIDTKSKSSIDLSAFSQLPDFGIFEASRLACPVLPQYHPKQLMELLAFGKIQRVKAILNHLVISLCTYDSSKTIGGQTTAKFSGSQKNLNSWTRTRTLSIAGGTPMSPNYNDSFEANIPAIPEEVQLDYTEITSVRPLPLFALIQAEIENPQQKSDKSTKDGNNTDNNNEYDSLFSTNQKSQIDETLDEILGKSSFNFNQMQKKQEKISLTDFGSKQARLLTKLLTHSHLPGLSSLDQMHLLALADAVASFNSKNENTKDESSGYGTEQKQTISSDSLDDCGLRFILTMRQHIYLLCCLPLVQRKQLQLQGLSPCNLVWAFHSEAQEEILQLIPCIQKQSPKWNELKELGIGWWIRSNFVLKRLVEQLAKSSFTAKQDPLDAALFYLAMKKKSLVWGLFRSIGDKRMTEFFQNNFTEDKWRKAALKNAFVLLGKQRFEHAAAFFLLAGSLYDAIEVCINKLDDLQLAMVIIRLYEGDVETVPETLKKILYQEVLGCAQDGTQYDSSKCHPDAFYRSMAYWMLGDYNSALNTLLEIDVGHNHIKYNPNESDKEININPSVFNFYLYLRNQPLIVRRQLAQTIQQDSKLVKGLLHENISSDAITPFERRLYFITAHQHFRAGCPSLALEVLSRLPNRIILDDQLNSKDTPRSSISSVILKQQSNDKAKILTESPAKDKAEDFDWGMSVSSQSNTNNKKEDKAEDLFDWSTPVSLQTKEDTQFKIDIQISSSSSSSDDEKDQVDNEKKTATFEKKSSLDQPPATTKETNNNEKLDKKETKLDIMAQQLRFIACLKILMEELSTLATGFEVDGGQLRYHLYVWLEKSVLALKVICNYRTFSMRSGIELFKNQAMILDDSDLTPAEKSPKHFESGYSDYKAPTLHEILIADKLDFEQKLQRAHRRKQWLQSNESLLRTLLSYCSLHGGHGGGLAAVRMELILLLQELQQDRSNNQLLSPVPFPTTLPLLAASVACQKTVIADPIKHLHSMTHDILETVLELRTIPLNLPPNYCEIYVLRDLGISLSACVYQSLCDSDSFSVKMSAKENKQSKISANLLTSNHATVKRQLTNASDSSNYSFKSGQLGKTAANSSHQLNTGNQNDIYLEQPISEPIKWPGVQSLRALLARDKDEDSPKLHTLLCESYCAVYLSQLLFALAACDSHILFRLVTLPFETKNWSQLFGGGVKKLLNVVKVSRMDSNLTTTSHLQTPGQAQSQNIGGSNLQTSTSGGIPIPQSSISSSAHQFFSTSQQSTSFDEQSSPTMNLLSALSKQRRNFNMKILQHLNQDKQSPSNVQMNEDKPTYREHFVAPQMSILSFLMTKTVLPDEMILIDYDSSESVQSEEDYDAQFDLSDNLYEENLFTLGQPKDIAANQSTYDQFAWGMMRYAVLKLCKQHLDQFLNVAGLEMQDLPTISPLIHSMFKVIDIWIDYLRNYMESFPDAPLPHFLPNTYVEPITNTGGPSIFKYKALLELNNTPFRHHNGITKPMKRLWNYLVRQELVQPIFIRYIFGQRKTINGVNQYVPPMDSNVETDYADKDETTVEQQNLLPRLDPTRIVHKDQDLISAFCVNHANPGLIALSTPKEIQELDMSVLLGPVPWLEEEAEYDILNLLRGPESLPSTNYLVVQHPSDRLQMSPANIAMQNSTPQVSMSSYQSLGQTGRSTIMPKHNFPGHTNPKFCQYVVERSRHILKPLKSHKLEGTKRMCSHPTLPLYLSGSQDGSVKLWEWNHQHELSTPQSPGKFGKVTRVLFNQLGNKFGICDADGNLSLWQVSLNTTKPFYTVKAHSKQCSDFAFLGCSSVVVTAGESVDHRNIALWDTLLKPRKSRVSSFSCLESHGASAILYCPINQVLLAGGRRGELCIIEVRQKKERAKWQAHETPIKCMALEPGESYFATGSADGDIKVWSLGPVSVLLFSFPGEHSRNTIFRNLGMGVSHLYIDSFGRLFSCGADASLKIKNLPDRNSNIVCSF